MKREFFSNLLLLVFINLLIKPVFIFGIDLGVQNRLGTEYGVYFALLNLTYLTQIINDFGIQNFNNRHVSQHPQLLAKYFPNLLVIKSLLSLGYVLITFTIAWLWLGYGWDYLPLLLILLINQVLVQFILFLRSNISGLGFFRTDSLLSALDKLLMLITCGAILWGEVAPLTLMTFALSQTFALFVTLIVVAVVLSRLTPLSLKPSWISNWKAGRPTLLYLFKQSIPYALVILLMFAYTRMDAVLLERMAGAAHADVYAGAFRILEACNMFGYLFASLLLPMFARLLRKKESIVPLTALSFKLIWAGSVTLAGAIFFSRNAMIHWMMPERANQYRTEVLGVLIWAFVLVSVTYIFSTLLTAKECLSKMNRMFVWGIAIDVTLNLILIPKWQAEGSAVAAVATQAFIAGAMIWLCVREFGWKMDTKMVLQVIGFLQFVLFFDFLLFHYSKLDWGWNFIAALFLGLLGLLVFQLIELKNIKRFLE